MKILFFFRDCTFCRRRENIEIMSSFFFSKYIYNNSSLSLLLESTFLCTPSFSASTWKSTGRLRKAYCITGRRQRSKAFTKARGNNSRANFLLWSRKGECHTVELPVIQVSLCPLTRMTMKQSFRHCLISSCASPPLFFSLFPL